MPRLGRASAAGFQINPLTAWRSPPRHIRFWISGAATEDGHVPPLERMTREQLDAVLAHPRHAKIFGVIEQLVTDLRSCRTNQNFYDFQQNLLDQVLETEVHRGACTRVVRRLKDGKGVPADAPEISAPEGLSESMRYKIEVDVCERIARQLRSVGDALAWRALDYQRQFIVALSRNDSPGPMAGKEGLAAERDFITRAWRDDGHLALLHDLTNCLRIGDASVFVPDGLLLQEIKTNPQRQEPAQTRRINEAAEALRTGTPLPRGGQRLVNLGIPYTTHLKILREVTDIAIERGLRGAKVPGGRVLTVACLTTAHQRWSEEEFGERFHHEHQNAMRRARIDGHNFITYGSLDRAGRNPADPPWAIYPMHPKACTGLITDRIAFIASIGGETLVQALATEGVYGRWLREDPSELADFSRPVLEVHDGRRRTSMNYSELHRLLLEFIDLGVWAKQVAAVLADDTLAGSPWPYFEGEREVWV
jgi:hypothetical protein